MKLQENTYALKKVTKKGYKKKLQKRVKKVTKKVKTSYNKKVTKKGKKSYKKKYCPFTCNGKLNGANRLTIEFVTSVHNYGNFIRQWFEVLRYTNNLLFISNFLAISYASKSHFFSWKVRI